MEYNIGDIVRTKKTHPCGSKLYVSEIASYNQDSSR